MRFVELGEYVCEVRAKRYWRLEQLKSFDEFLEKRFADSRRIAYYPMAISRKSDPDPETRVATGGLEQSDRTGQGGTQGSGRI